MRVGWVRFAAALAALGVAAGAFGAHGLRDHVPATRLAVWETAARYQLIHALALLTLALAPIQALWTRRLMAAGVLIFSGTLYLLVLLDQGWLGAVTPLGGSLLIAAWCTLLVEVSRPPTD